MLIIMLLYWFGSSLFDNSLIKVRCELIYHNDSIKPPSNEPPPQSCFLTNKPPLSNKPHHGDYLGSRQCRSITSMQKTILMTFSSFHLYLHLKQNTLDHLLFLVSSYKDIRIFSLLVTVWQYFHTTIILSVRCVDVSPPLDKAHSRICPHP